MWARLECLTAKFHDLARQIIFGGYIQVNHRRISDKKYRASVLLRSYYIVEDGKSPYLDATKTPDTRYSYLYSALLADMNIFSGINIRWIDEPTDVQLPLKTSIRKNINPVESDPEGYQRLWRFKI